MKAFQYRNRTHFLRVLLPFVLLIQGCASMSEAECQAANWTIRGEDDALQGHPHELINEHTKACAEYGITPDLEAYRAGWEQGIKEYCTSIHGWEVGIAGDFYENSCPPALQSDFLAAYRAGKGVFDQRAVVADFDARLDEVNLELDEGGLDEERKAKLKKQRKKLKKKLAEAQGVLLLQEIEARNAGFPLP